MVRENNEDQFLIADLKKSVIIHQTSLSYDNETELLGGSHAKLMLVADGVGGNSCGERASSLALEGIIQYLLNSMHWILHSDQEQSEVFLEDLKSALKFTQEKISHAAAAVPSQEGMGTTVTMAYVVWPHVYFVHAGDSRAYICRDGKLTRITHDQTYAQALADAGVLTQEQIKASPLSHILSSLLGCDPEQLDPLVFKAKLSLNDTLLLCTDGLTRHLNDSEIADIVSSERCARSSCRRLIDCANDAGGRDNTTVVVARFSDLETAAECQDQAAAETPQSALKQLSSELWSCLTKVFSGRSRQPDSAQCQAVSVRTFAKGPA